MAAWIPPEPPNGIITAYSIFCRLLGDENFTLLEVVRPPSLERTLDGLMPFTNYTCVVTANTSAGEGQETEPQSATTDQAGECVDTNTKPNVEVLQSFLSYCVIPRVYNKSMQKRVL